MFITQLMHLQSICCIVHDSQSINKTGDLAYSRWHNFTDRLSDYFQQAPLIGNMTDRVHRFNEMLSNLFHYGNVSHTDNIHQQLQEYHNKIQNYFRTFIPDEQNMLETLDRFSNRLSEYLKAFNITSDRGRIVIERFYDFTKRNLSDFHEDIEGEDKSFDNILERFMRRVEEYLGGVGSTKDSELNVTTSDVKKEEPRYFVVYERRMYANQKYTMCNSKQIDICRHKCGEENKVLCGCFFIINQYDGDIIDCICADKASECATNHTHWREYEQDREIHSHNKDL